MNENNGFASSGPFPDNGGGPNSPAAGDGMTAGKNLISESDMTADEKNAGEDIIAALSTPAGRGGVALIRVSGAGCLALVSRLTGRDLTAQPPHTIRRAVFRAADGRPLDDGMVSVFRAPHSFTGEDTVELNCHGGLFVVTAVLGELYALGIRPAGAGEFTCRAFLNGRLGLSAAEAIADIIDAENREQLSLAVTQASGGLGREFDRIYRLLQSLVAEMYVRIDYPDADLPAGFVPSLDEAAAALEKLQRGYRTGRAIRDGVNAVICGAPNVGKSSLWNCLLGEERAIVTDIAGTTRDALSERLTLGGVTLRLWDTAGLRDTDDPVERIGVDLARRRLEDAELILAVFDASRPPDAADAEALDALAKGIPAAALLNKSDLGGGFAYPIPANVPAVRFSALTGEGRQELERTVSSLFGTADVSGALLLSNARQYAAVRRASGALRDAQEALCEGQPDDIVGSLLEESMAALGECDGRAVSQSVVDEIFSRFCVGK